MVENWPVAKLDQWRGSQELLHACPPYIESQEVTGCINGGGFLWGALHSRVLDARDGAHVVAGDLWMTQQDLSSALLLSTPVSTPLGPSWAPPWKT